MQAQQRSADPAFVAFALGILAADLQLSAYLYSQGVPYTMISAALAVSECPPSHLSSLRVAIVAALAKEVVRNHKGITCIC